VWVVAARRKAEKALKLAISYFSGGILNKVAARRKAEKALKHVDDGPKASRFPGRGEEKSREGIETWRGRDRVRGPDRRGEEKSREGIETNTHDREYYEHDQSRRGEKPRRH